MEKEKTEKLIALMEMLGEKMKSSSPEDFIEKVTDITFPKEEMPASIGALVMMTEKAKENNFVSDEDFIVMKEFQEKGLATLQKDKLRIGIC